jgi:hypothetical protein
MTMTSPQADPQDAEDRTSLEALVAELRGTSQRKVAKRVAAVHALTETALTPDDRAVAIKTLHGLIDKNLQDGPTSRIISGMLRSLLWVVPTSLLAAYGFLMGVGRPPTLEAVAATFVLPFVIGVMLAAGFLVPLHISLENKDNESVVVSAVEALGGFGYPGSVSKLVAASSDRRPAMQDAAESSLRTLLSHLVEGGARLGTAASQHLGFLLNYPKDGIVQLALDTLERGGSGAALPAVERLARQGETGALRRRAAHVAEILRERIRHDGDRESLLRAVSSPAGTEEVLLRPAGAGATEQDLLLRPDPTAD